MTKTIMVVDDQEDIRYSLKSLFEKNGYTVMTAENGEDCLTQIKVNKPDLILNLEGIKVIFLSAVRMSDDEKDNLMKGNILAYVQKPANNEQLLQQVKEAIG